MKPPVCAANRGERAAGLAWKWHAGPATKEYELAIHDEVCAAILLIARFVMFITEGVLLAIAGRLDPGFVDAQADHVFLGSIGAAIPKPKVIFLAPPLIAVAFDGEANVAVQIEKDGIFLQRFARVGTNVGLVIIKISVFHCFLEHLVKVFGVSGWRRDSYRDACAGFGMAPTAHGGDRVGGGVVRVDLA